MVRGVMARSRASSVTEKKASVRADGAVSTGAVSIGGRSAGDLSGGDLSRADLSGAEFVDAIG
ncbi:hypothetical protein GCM10007301_31320 [Azorhizobium oxalatiphilum]|uniref:Pentapeptide repeat-containing protein n=1 Tax=Azorhizobium oxalatiphilum TaxID=980631 RepID=A0A917FF08_9HYPH|nr:hypothetical protein GCM10007301_31320 [Azorhizobium oxalatiphilum]